jgi:hypothetical protein
MHISNVKTTIDMRKMIKLKLINSRELQLCGINDCVDCSSLHSIEDASFRIRLPFQVILHH